MASLKLFASVLKAIPPGDFICVHIVIQLIRLLSSNVSATLAYMVYVFRWTYIEFYSRYSVLMSHLEADLNDKKQTCKNVLQRLIQVLCVLYSTSLYKQYQGLHLYTALSPRVFISRTLTSTSLAAQRSSSEPVRWLIWRSCV